MAIKLVKIEAGKYEYKSKKFPDVIRFSVEGRRGYWEVKNHYTEASWFGDTLKDVSRRIASWIATNENAEQTKRDEINAYDYVAEHNKIVARAIAVNICKNHVNRFLSVVATLTQSGFNVSLMSSGNAYQSYNVQTVAQAQLIYSALALLIDKQIKPRTVAAVAKAVQA